MKYSSTHQAPLMCVYPIYKGGYVMFKFLRLVYLLPSLHFLHGALLPPQSRPASSSPRCESQTAFGGSILTYWHPMGTIFNWVRYFRIAILLARTDLAVDGLPGPATQSIFSMLLSVLRACNSNSTKLRQLPSCVTIKVLIFTSERL